VIPAGDFRVIVAMLGLMLLNARSTSGSAKRVDSSDSFVLNLRSVENELCDHAKNSVTMTTPFAPAPP
jgi:hypothetical protein